MRLHVALLCATALGLCATSALAQRPSGRGPERRAQLLFKGITLTLEQQAKVDSIQTYYREQMPSFTPGSPPRLRDAGQGSGAVPPPGGGHSRRADRRPAESF
jgi:Spy/CpxP family protein refolding chaperone